MRRLGARLLRVSVARRPSCRPRRQARPSVSLARGGSHDAVTANADDDFDVIAGFSSPAFFSAAVQPPFTRVPLPPPRPGNAGARLLACQSGSIDRGRAASSKGKARSGKINAAVGRASHLTKGRNEGEGESAPPRFFPPSPGGRERREEGAEEERPGEGAQRRHYRFSESLTSIHQLSSAGGRRGGRTRGRAVERRRRRLGGRERALPRLPALA